MKGRKTFERKKRTRNLSKVDQAAIYMQNLGARWDDRDRGLIASWKRLAGTSVGGVEGSAGTPVGSAETSVVRVSVGISVNGGAVGLRVGRGDQSRFGNQGVVLLDPGNGRVVSPDPGNRVVVPIRGELPLKPREGGFWPGVVGPLRPGMIGWPVPPRDFLPR